MLAEVVRSTSGNAGPVVLFCDAEDSEAHPGIVASFFGVSEIPYHYEASPPPQPQRGGVVGTKTSEPCREPPRRRASPTGLPADPAGGALPGRRLPTAWCAPTLSPSCRERSD